MIVVEFQDSDSYEVEDGSKCKSLGIMRIQAMGREPRPAWPDQWKGKHSFSARQKPPSSPFLPKCWAVFSFSVVFRQGRNPSPAPVAARSPGIPVWTHNGSMHISLSSLFVLQRRSDIGKSLQQALNDV